MKQKIYFIITLCFLYSNCTSHTEETTDETKKILPNGKLLIVEKINRDKTSQGIFTHHTYAITHSFEYNITINEGNIHWDTKSGEPKNILFCKNDTYIRYLKEKTIRTKNLDTIDTLHTYNYHLETTENFQKHVDKRYFFKLLGDDFWIDISSEDYITIKESCSEYKVPNDNELTLNNN